MADPAWDESIQSWRLPVHSQALGQIDVLISTDGAGCPPTGRQRSTAELLAALPLTLLTDVAAQARAYAADYMSDDDFEELSDADFEIPFSTCIIPRLRNSPNHYFFLLGGSQIDEEHGIACLFKNHDQCRVCHTDDAYNHWDWDDTPQLDSLLRS